MKYKFMVAIFFVLLSSSYSQQNEKKHVVICFDVEDYITPESDSIDALPKWMAEIMTEEGVKGMFFVIGEKARSLENRKRTDVIKAMAKHDIGSHTNWGSIHPTITEVLEKMNFKDGLKLIKKREGEGFKDLERVFGKSITAFGRHGGSYGPQLVAALSEMNAGYIYTPIFLPGHYASWFCNTINFYGEGDIRFDDTYHKDKTFNPMLDSLKCTLSSLLEDTDGLTFFACHPCKVRTVQYWDFNYYYGVNRDSVDWKTPELRPRETMATARKNFRKLIQFFKSRDDIELTTFNELMKLYSYQRAEINSAELNKIAQRILTEKTVVIDDYYSPAETFSALAEMIINNTNGTFPKEVKITRPFGPLTMPQVVPSLKSVSKESVVVLAQKALDYIKKENSIPASLNCKGEAVGTGSLLALFSQYFVDMYNNKISDVYTLQPFDAYPHKNEEAIIQNISNYKTWPVHRKNLDMTNLIEMTKMQLWTLKPAWSNKAVAN